ncbi:Vacuolar protein-sorting-associated protein 27, partial [Linderina macrospora]
MPKINVVASTAMGDTESAPEWEDSSVCQRCRTAFSFTNRKHHCRHCGKCFCQDCSSNSTPIPKFAIYEPVRVCHGCYLRLKKIVPSTDDQASSSKAKDTTDWSQMDRKTDTQTNAASAGTPDVNDDDEDLKLAIELSLKEAQQQPNYADFMRPTTTAPAAITTAAPAATTAVVSTPAYASQITYPSLTSNEPYPLTSEHGDDMDEEDDPDLRAAIEASLQDVKASTAGPDYLSAPVQSAPVYAETHHSLDFMPHVQEDDSGDEEPLASDERENVQLFESLLIRIRDSGQDIRYDPQIQYLHESIEQLHPKITDAMDHVDQKHKEFIKLHDRILTAIRIYDQLLDKRLRSSSLFSADMAPPSIASYTPAPPSSVYPAATSQSPMPAGHQSYYQAPPAQPAYSPLPQQQQLS